MTVLLVLKFLLYDIAIELLRMGYGEECHAEVN